MMYKLGKGEWRGKTEETQKEKIEAQKEIEAGGLPHHACRNPIEPWRDAYYQTLAWLD